MSQKALPSRPNYDQYRKQAKELLRAAKAGSPEALARFAKFPRQKSANLTLADAQWAIAREHGFASWSRFVRHIESLAPRDPPAATWKAAQKALFAADAEALDLLLTRHETVIRAGQPPAYGPGGLRPDYSQGDARSIITREHHFETWEQVEEFKRQSELDSSPVAQFEAAVDAIVFGRLATLENLLRANPALVRARSLRKHRSTLLHYVGSNGVEEFRQKCPKNIVAIARLLLAAGAAIDAQADMYGGGQTVFDLAATSVHPVHAGVLLPLLETLLDAGADIHGPRGASLVKSCLANGRPQAAEFLAARGAPLDLESAAGVGRLDLVEALLPNAVALMKDGFTWACEFGRTAVVEFLLNRGVDPATPLKHRGQTGLHWAAAGGHIETVKALLAHHAPVNALDQTWHTTPLSWTLFGWRHRASDVAPESYYQVAALLVASGATVEADWLADEAIRKDRRMLRALQSTPHRP